MFKTAIIVAVGLAIASAAATPSRRIPNVTTDFCADAVDFQMDKNGSPVGSNFSYRVCMDVARARSRMECSKSTDVQCPGGPDLALSVFTGGVMYTLSHNGSCVSKPCPTCGDPRGIPFSFLLIDGANGDTSRGVATYQGQANIDGQLMDHFLHDRGTVAPGYGVMNWYLVGDSLMRNAYVEAKTSPQNPGGSGTRDFSGVQQPGGKGTRTEPAPEASFAIPEGCKKPTSPTWAALPAFGDFPEETTAMYHPQCCFCGNGGEGSGACLSVSACNTKGGGYKCMQTPGGCQWTNPTPLKPKGGCV